jgi:hypothetical protein
LSSPLWHLKWSTPSISLSLDSSPFSTNRSAKMATASKRGEGFIATSSAFPERVLILFTCSPREATDYGAAVAAGREPSILRSLGLTR